LWWLWLAAWSFQNDHAVNQNHHKPVVVQ
jgi:hypothetical protein